MLYPPHFTRRALMASLALSMFTLAHQNASAQAEARALGHLDASAPVSLALSLPLRNAAQLDSLLRRLYDPTDPQFHQFLTPAQFAGEFAPTPQEYQAVADAVRAQGLTVTGTHPNRLLLDVSGPDAAVESAFGTRLTVYTAANGHVFRAPDAAPSLPAALAGRVSGVIGLDTSIVRQPHLQRLHATTTPLPGSGPGGGLTPLDVKAAYGLDTVPLDGTGQTLAVFELDGYTESDIRAYEDRFGLPRIPLVNIYVDGVSGQPGSGADEVTLDTELVSALAPRAQRVLVYEGPNSDQGIVDTYNRIAMDDQANEISTSWGSPEGDTSQVNLNGRQPEPAFMDAENTVFEQMAVQGQAIFAATGDNGAEDNGRTLSVDDPGSQPYVTSVGGTTLTTNATGGTYNSQTVWNSVGYGNQRGAGGGGISAAHALPSYQGGISTTSPISATHRNVPDVSLNSDPQTGYATYFGGQWIVYGGTSTAAPLWAGFTALVNQQRALLGESALGFANPPIYALAKGSHYAQDFNDVTTGNNDLTQNDPAHYEATTGYDLASGWGSPNGAHLLADLAGTTAATAQPGPYAYNAGWNLLSLPYDDSAYTPDAVFGFLNANLYVWDPTRGFYAETPTYPADAVRHGVGYWLYVPAGFSPATTRVNGAATDATAPSTAPALSAGWNQIGDPFPYPIPLANTQFTDASGTQTPFVGAEEAGWISGVLFQYNNATGSYVAVSEPASLQPGRGYWLFAYRGVSLQVPPP